MAQPSVVVLIARLIGLGSLVVQSLVVQSLVEKATRVKGGISHTIPSPSLSHQNSRLHIHHPMTNLKKFLLTFSYINSIMQIL